MDSFHPTQASLSPYKLLFRALSSIPISHYLLASLFCFLIFLYNFLGFHFLEDVLSGLRGCPVSLTFNSRSQIYEGVVSKCRILHGRYLATPWLSSPHFQTAFLNFFGRPPVVNYRRKIFHASDGGSIALDWLLHSDVLGGAFHLNNAISKDDTTPIVVVIPGLTSDSTSADLNSGMMIDSARLIDNLYYLMTTSLRTSKLRVLLYIKHFAFNMVKRGWNIVVSNHRGLGGISITSDCFYNAGWTEDIREVIDYLHHEYPVAPLFAVGTSIGANILVKYLGEDGENIPVAGAVAICNPWDLLIGDRFISRRLLQKFYDMALTSGLQGYAQLHQPRYSRLADWDGIKKSRSIRDFDTYATCLVGKFETADTYYRRCSSASFVGNVAVPLLCVSALDDPVCTREAIPWDECRENKNVILATPQHGGHLAFFEGIAARSLWWVRAVDEFLSVLHSSPFMHKQKKILNSSPHSSLESAIDQGPYVNFAEDGMMAVMGNEQTSTVVGPLSEGQNIHDKSSDNEMASDSEQDEHTTTENSALVPNIAQTSKLAAKPSSIRKCLEKLSQHNRISMWLMAYIAVTTSWPLVGSALQFVFKNKFRSVLPAVLHGR